MRRPTPTKTDPPGRHPDRAPVICPGGSVEVVVTTYTNNEPCLKIVYVRPPQVFVPDLTLTGVPGNPGEDCPTVQECPAVNHLTVEVAPESFPGGGIPSGQSRDFIFNITAAADAPIGLEFICLYPDLAGQGCPREGCPPLDIPVDVKLVADWQTSHTGYGAWHRNPGRSNPRPVHRKLRHA